jgi:uncharacterized protein (DUF2235 family)
MQGTWEGSEAKTNVYEISILTAPDPGLSADDFEQIVLYIDGVGATETNTLNHVFDGLTGNGLVDRMFNAYSFVVKNWRKGDEIYLFGFSRGAYEARVVCSLIGKYGLLSQPTLNFESLLKAHQKNPLDPSTVGKEWNWLSREVPIKCIGVWETVGSLGIPELYFFGTPVKLFPCLHRWIRGIDRKYEFPDPYINKRVEFAFHAYTP